MKQLVTLVALLCVSGLALARPGSIAGIVTDQETGSPIAGAIVVARGDSGSSGQAGTSPRGQYQITNLRPGRYRVMAEARGYERKVYPEAVVVREGEVTSGIDFQLRPIRNPQVGAIAGRVTDRRTGEPVPNAVVLAQAENCRGKARTDASGAYAIRGLQPGRYQVSAKAREYQGEVFPRPVAVQAGEVTRDIDFALTPRPHPGAIIGRVYDARTRNALAGAVVVAQGEHGSARAVTDQRGIYRLKGLHPGRYEVRAAARGYEPAVYPRPVPVRPNAATRDIDFALNPRTIGEQ